MSANKITQFATNICNEAEQHRGKTPSQSYIEALNAATNQSDHIEEIRLNVVASLSKISSPSGAGFIGVWLGGAIESGNNPDPFIPYLLDYFIKTIKELALDNEEELQNSPENDERLIGLEYLGQALVAHLSRSQTYRDKMANDSNIIELFDEYSSYSPGITWVYELLSKHSDELIVLHIESKKGVRLRYENLSNCFHLFTLIQQTVKDIFPHEIDEDEYEEDECEEDDDINLDQFTYAWWHYGQGSIPNSDLLSTVWGEMSPKGISYIDGVQVLLLWPMIMASRSWDEGFFHPVLEAAPANLKHLETLTPEQVKTWFERLKIKPEHAL